MMPRHSPVHWAGAACLLWLAAAVSPPAAVDGGEDVPVVLVGDHTFSRAAWDAMQHRVQCWSTHGHWRTGQNAQFAGNLTSRLTRVSASAPELAWHWRPQRECEAAMTARTPAGGRVAVAGTYLPFGAAGFCSVLRGRSILMVGDSMTRQMHQTMQDLAQQHGEVCQGSGQKAGTCKGHVLCPSHPQPVHMQWRRSDRLLLDTARPFWGAGGYKEEAWAHELRGYDIVVLNRGAHFEADEPCLAQWRRTLAFLRGNYPQLLVVVRNTPPGHPNCRSHHRPLSKPPKTGRGQPFHWGEFSRQNALLGELVLREFPGVLLLDVATPTALRSDLHRGGVHRVADCLHYRIPGPIDNWVIMLHSALALIEEWAAAMGTS